MTVCPTSATSISAPWPRLNLSGRYPVYTHPHPQKTHVFRGEFIFKQSRINNMNNYTSVPISKQNPLKIPIFIVKIRLLGAL
jgi:hypothetical protein